MHENEIIDVIEKAGFEGINVRGMVDRGLSPDTLQKYLPILENEKRLIYHERIKNSHVYMISHFDQLSYKESHEFMFKTLDEFEDIINQVLDKTKNWGVSEQIEVYHNMIHGLLMMKYFKQFAVDILKVDNPRIPEDIEIFEERINEIISKINKKINLFYLPLIMLQLQNSMGESMNYLENIAKDKRKRGKKAKHVEKMIKDIESDPKQMKAIEKLLNKIEKTLKIIKK